MLFFIVVGLLIVLNSVTYTFSRNQFVLFAVGFMAGLFVAKIFIIVGY
jgi:hypothetical protein